MPGINRNLLALAVALGSVVAAQARAGTVPPDPPSGEKSAAVPASAPAAADPQQAQSLPEPPIAAAAQTSFVLRAVEFSGVSGVPEAELQAAVAGWIGKPVTLADLERLAARAAAVYRQHGFALAQVFVPVQEVVDGRVRLSVVEGRLGAVDIEVAPEAPITRERVARTLAILEPGKPLNNRDYERAMLLLSDLPGIRPQSAVSVGDASGSNDLSVRVGAQPRLKYGLELDDYGTRDSGRVRLTGSLRWASPFERGDNLDLRLMMAQGMHTAFGRLSYESPVGYSGLRLGGGLARVQYELGGPFAPLKPTGVGNVADLSFSYPLIRQRTTNLFLRGALDDKHLTDRFEAVGFTTRKRIHGISLGLAFERRDRWGGGGYSSVNAQLYRGKLDIRDPLSRLFDRPPFGYGTQGEFTKFTLQAARLQYLAPRLSLFLGLGLQRANKNLDAYEKLSLGGPKAVRAYAIGEVLVDDGWIATAELRHPLSAQTTLFAFYDAAQGDQFHRARPFDPDLSRSLRGYGLGLNWSKPGNVTVNLSVAWRGTGPGVTDGGDRNPRVFWTIQKAF
ncbi:MAG: ShlB/FhaC/HecB family hemolysin secretion/activation protein [Xanthomonadales bacterium]|nr:ShlB/FhaC/HecB family hemolysin secretion/activation protein [Xanthomonadales bacterium]MBN8795114.1 ShlB/FhaC/HecB family hemolysin secretion/activation protein [Stenotrophomonas nitritireducens]